MKLEELDYLFIGAHPDDCEIFCGGTILHLLENHRVGICDLSRGEMGSNGNVQKRKKEMQKANDLMKISWRKTLDIEDGTIENNEKNVKKVVRIIRETRPKMIFTFADRCRHPDHITTHHLVKRSAFLSGLAKFAPSKQNPHRPLKILFFAEFYPLPQVDFVIDITPYWEMKKELIRCYDSQIKTNEKSIKKKEVRTYIKSDVFWRNLETLHRCAGVSIGVCYGESFYSEHPLKIKNPIDHY